MLLDDEIHDIGHERRVPGPSVVATEIHDESEMKIPVSCMSGDTRNESMPGE